MSLDEWADTFAGSFGLGHLEELSHDPQLKPSGRKIAVEISDYISSGQHQAQLLSALKEHWYVWPISCDLLCIYVADGIRSGHWTTGPKSYDLEFPH